MWSIAARMAGWPDRRPLWTASCPCQPWSAAGQQLGVDDPRHLWPHLFRILSAYRRAGYAVPVIVGEQVAGAAGYHWFDGVRTDLAREEIAARTVDIPACAVDAPHQRNRLYWAAVSRPEQRFISGAVALAQEQRRWTGLRESDAERHRIVDANGYGRNGLLAHPEGQCGGRDLAQRGPEGRTADGFADEDGAMVDAEGIGRGEGRAQTGIFGGRAASPGADLRERGQGPVGDAIGAGFQGLGGDVDRGRADRRRPDGDSGDGEVPAAHRSIASPDGGGRGQDVADTLGGGWSRFGESQHSGIEGASGGIPLGRSVDRLKHGPNGSWWADGEWIVCHDGKARRAKPGIRMLVNGMAGRIDLWRLAGNSIIPILAAEVIGAILDAEEDIANSI